MKTLYIYLWIYTKGDTQPLIQTWTLWNIYLPVMLKVFTHRADPAPSATCLLLLLQPHVLLPGPHSTAPMPFFSLSLCVSLSVSLCCQPGPVLYAPSRWGDSVVWYILRLLVYGQHVSRRWEGVVWRSSTWLGIVSKPMILRDHAGD